MKKLSVTMAVIISGVMFAFIGVETLAQENGAPAPVVPSPVSTVVANGDQIAEPVIPAAPKPETAPAEKPAVVAPAVGGKNGAVNGSVAEITVTSKTGAPPESAETKGAPAAANLITVAFDNVPVQDVVNMFAQISGANIIMAGSFTNMFITANLKNVDWKSALNLALGSVNLSMIEDPSGILMVVTSEMYPQKLKEIEATKPLTTRTIVPKYLSAVDLVEQIKLFNVLSPRGSITTSQSREQDKVNLKSSETKAALTLQNPSITTAIVVTDIKEYVDKVEALIQSLDRREPQVYIEARIINVVAGDSKKVGIDWSMLDSFGVQAGLKDLTWNYNDGHSVQNNTVNNNNQWDKRKNVDGLHGGYDINGQSIEDITDGDATIQTIGGVTPARTITDTIDRGRDITANQTDTILDTMSQSRTATAFLNVSQVSLLLSALEKNSNAEMISHPQLVVGNRVEAKIHVGKKYPVLPTISTTITGTTPTIQYSDGETIILDLGLTLWVIPEIDFKNNIIRLTVRPETATQDGEVKNPQTGKTYPIVLSRDLVTRINVPSGHTVAIAGLVENTTSKQEIKVPVLGDIPLLGWFFRHTEDVMSRNNLIILITPTILDDNKPLTGLEAVAQLTIDKYEKTPLSAIKAPASNAAPNVVTIGSDAVTPAAGMNGPASSGKQTADDSRRTAEGGASGAKPGNQAASPAPSAPALAATPSGAPTTNQPAKP